MEIIAQDIPEIILNNLPSGIIFCDRHCRIHFINKTYADYLGIDQQGAIGKHIHEYIPGSRISHVMKSGAPEFGFRCSVGKGKEKKILIVNRIPVSDGENNTIGVISQSLFGDIGELKDLSERLQVLEKKVTSYRERIRSVLSAKYCLDDIKGESPDILKAKKLLESYAKTDSSVLLIGVTGTGKELFAQALHNASDRASGPFVSINCAAIPSDLLESELFGYAPGAFTGARKEGKLGNVELAHKGTLFLDEIGDMPLQAQVKLLRVIEEKTVHRLGDTTPKKVAFRLIAATNRDLKQLIDEGKFREDLYYRLNTMTISIPRLSERTEDIVLLVRHMLDSMGLQDVSCSADAMDVLKGYAWPGNVRELRNVIECAASLCKNGTVGVRDLPREILRARPGETSSGDPSNYNSGASLADHEKVAIFEALMENGWNMARTAAQLGISRATLYKKVRKYGIKSAGSRSATN